MFKHSVIYDEEISDFEICFKHLEQILIRICNNGTDIKLPDEKKGAFKIVAAIAKEVLIMISRGGDIIDRGKMPSNITDLALQQIFTNNLDNLICIYLSYFCNLKSLIINHEFQLQNFSTGATEASPL